MLQLAISKHDAGLPVEVALNSVYPSHGLVPCWSISTLWAKPIFARGRAEEVCDSPEQS